jgi:hypothetical protein
MRLSPHFSATRAPYAHPPPTPSCRADAELYKARHQEESQDPASVAERGPEIPLAGDDLLAWLSPRKARAFPRTYTHVTPRGSKQVELFANLIEMVEELIDKPQRAWRLRGPLGRTSSLIWPTFGEGTAHGRAHGGGGEAGSVGYDDSPSISRHADVQVGIQRPTAGAQRSARPPPPTGGPLRSTRVAPVAPSCIAVGASAPDSSSLQAGSNTAGEQAPTGCNAGGNQDSKRTRGNVPGLRRSAAARAPAERPAERATSAPES